MQTTDSFSKAIILGATGGIGRHLATELAKHLDFLVLVGQNPDKLSQLQKELAGSKAQLSIMVLNLCDKEALENFGKVLDADLLVNCTGLASFSIGSDLATEKEQELWQVNYHAPVQLMKLLVQKNRKIRLVQRLQRDVNSRIMKIQQCSFQLKLRVHAEYGSTCTR